MGDYSRDTFQLTNVMHQVLTGDTVADGRHYVGVRLQQAVPLLDADWNELEDIHRVDAQINLRHYFGDGIPSDNGGFQVGPVTEDNDFTINAGMALVSGMLVFNEHSGLTYRGQDAAFGVSMEALDPPLVGTRDDLIYLDVWHEELGPTGVGRVDERLTNPSIGIETARRIERRWLVRVAPGVSDIDGVTQEPGHVYMALARARREAGQARITSDRIFDMRRTDINVARYLKVPMLVSRGGDFVDSTRFADLLESLRSIFLARLEDEELFLTGVLDHDRTVVHFAVQQITQVCGTGSLQARTNSLTNTDALQVMSTLVAAQQDFLASLTVHGMGGVVMDTFIGDYTTPRLADVQAAVTDDDLLGAYQQQQALNAWLSAAVGTLPEGSVSRTILAVNPTEPLVAGTTYTFFVEVTSSVTSDQTNEIFDVVASLSSDLWQLPVASMEITLDNVGGAASSGVVQFDVIPNAANVQSDFSVVATARRNPTIQTPQPPLALEIGSEPFIGGVLQYAGPPLNPAGRLELTEASLNNPFGTSISFSFNNDTAASHEYFVEWFLTLSVGDETGWSPLSASVSDNSVVVLAESSDTLALNISGPTGEAIAGSQGTLHVTLVGRDLTNPLPTAEQETLEVEFEVV
jgi:hypothetical protein